PSVWANAQPVTSSNPTAVSAVLTGGAAAGGFSIGVQRLASADQVTQQTPLAAANGDDTLHIQVRSGAVANVAISSGDTLATIARTVNPNTSPQVHASAVNRKHAA